MSGRRDFIKSTLGISALMLAEPLARPVEQFLGQNSKATNPWRKVYGKVTSDGKPLAGVAVSDSATITVTAADGSYELYAGKNEKFVFITNPAGHTIATNPTGTARFYEPLTEASEIEVNFSLITSGDDTQHSFFLLADPQPLDMDDIALFNQETIPDLIEMAEGRKHLFGVACGDIVFNDLKLFPEYEKAISKTKIPFYQVLGNHDTDHSSATDETSAETFNRHFGPDYYSFNKGAVHYVVMNDVFWFGHYIGYIDQKQLDWLQQDLALVKPGTTVVVFTHIPPFNTQHIRYKKEPSKSEIVVNRKLLYALLKPYKSYIITGHMHESEYIEEEGVEIHVVGAVCGAWWTAPTCFDGTPKGYGIYEVSGNELKWKYKSTGKPATYQISIQKRGSMKDKPDEIMANIWGWDKYCKVFWHEDGKPMGEMERRTAMDPESIYLFEGDKKPKKHTWVEPALTDHLFFAKPSKGAKMVVVEFFNRWGERFTAKHQL